MAEKGLIVKITKIEKSVCMARLKVIIKKKHLKIYSTFNKYFYATNKSRD